MGGLLHTDYSSDYIIDEEYAQKQSRYEGTFIHPKNGEN